MNKIILVIVVFLMSCSSSAKSYQRVSPEEELKNALLEYQDENYQTAKQLAEDALYYLGECNMKIDKFIVAAYTFSQIIERYSSSRYTERAQYKQALCYFNLSPSYSLDQKYTKRAIKFLKEFYKDWPK